MKNKKRLITTIIINLLFFLIILELALRLLSLFFIDKPHLFLFEENKHFKSRLTEKINKHNYYKIVCMGDSYTKGTIRYANENKDSYPFQLQKILNKDKTKQYLVINEGICEANSRQILLQLPKIKQLYDPQMIILLVGASNKYNPVGIFAKSTEISLNNKETLKNNPLNKLLILDFFRILHINLKAFLVKHKFYSYQEEYSKKSLYKAGISKKTIASIKNKSISLDNLKTLINNLNRLFLAKKLHEPQIYQELAQISIQSYKQYDLAFYCLMQYFTFFPYNKEKIHLGDMVYFSILYDIQSQYDHIDVINCLNNIIKKNPALKKDSNIFNNYYAYFLNKEKYEKNTEKILKQDLENILYFCQKNKIQLILMNYPYWYKTANNTILNVASKNNIVFIDNHKYFKNILNNNKNFYYYFSSENHLTKQGCKIQANYIYEKIFSKPDKTLH